jgi:hypothetical protein
VHGAQLLPNPGGSESSPLTLALLSIYYVVSCLWPEMELADLFVDLTSENSSSDLHFGSELASGYLNTY